MDNIFVLNHLTQRKKRYGEKEEKVYAVFADMKAAFANVDRGKLWEIMREKGIQELLIQRLEKIYEETEVVVRTGQGSSRQPKE